MSEIKLAIFPRLNPKKKKKKKKKIYIYIYIYKIKFFKK